MDLISKYLVKKAVKKHAEKIISRIEGVTLHDGIYLNVFNSGVKIDLSKVIKKVREYGVKEVRKQLKKM